MFITVPATFHACLPMAAITFAMAIPLQHVPASTGKQPQCRGSSECDSIRIGVFSAPSMTSVTSRTSVSLQTASGRCLSGHNMDGACYTRSRHNPPRSGVPSQDSSLPIHAAGDHGNVREIESCHDYLPHVEQEFKSLIQKPRSRPDAAPYQ